MALTFSLNLTRKQENALCGIACKRIDELKACMVNYEIQTLYFEVQFLRNVWRGAGQPVDLEFRKLRARLHRLKRERNK